jgi:hypothetical protein
VTNLSEKLYELNHVVGRSETLVRICTDYTGKWKSKYQRKVVYDDASKS